MEAHSDANVNGRQRADVLCNLLQDASEHRIEAAMMWSDPWVSYEQA